MYVSVFIIRDKVETMPEVTTDINTRYTVTTKVEEASTHKSANI